VISDQITYSYHIQKTSNIPTGCFRFGSPTTPIDLPRKRIRLHLPNSTNTNNPTITSAQYGNHDNGLRVLRSSNGRSDRKLLHDRGEADACRSQPSNRHRTHTKRIQRYQHTPLHPQYSTTLEFDGTSAGDSNKRRWTTGKHGDTKLHDSSWNTTLHQYSIHQYSTHIYHNEQSNINNHHRHHPTDRHHNHIHPNHHNDLINQPIPPTNHNNPGGGIGGHTFCAEKLAQET